MRTAAVVVLGLAVALSVAGVILYFAVPANRTADDGPADPILEVRRPVIKALKAVGILKFDERFPNWYLPTRSWQPVYRGLLWPVGWRVTERVTDYNDLGMRSARLCYAIGNERFLSAETYDPGAKSVDLTGFVPFDARGVWTEMTSEEGRVCCVWGTGDVDPFWRE